MDVTGVLPTGRVGESPSAMGWGCCWADWDWSCCCTRGGIRGPGVLLSYGVYGASLVLLYLASTLYHSVSSVAARRWSKLFDHCAIYLLIAGTYTPSCWWRSIRRWHKD